MPKRIKIAAHTLLNFFIFFMSQTTNVCQAQCSAGTQAELVSCLASFAASGGSIALTSTITLSSNFDLTNKSFTLRTNSFNILTNGKTISSMGTPTMNVTRTSGTVAILKNGTGATFSGLTANGDLIAYVSTFNPTLAAEIIAFDAKIKDNQAILTWQTASEKDAAYFDIERRSADNPFFTTIGSVKATNAPNTYSYVDNAPLPTNYYRLRQVDQNSKEIFSKIVALSVKASEKLKIYPSLVKDVLTVEIANDVDFKIVNLFGQEVFTGKGNSRVDVAFLPVGTYVLKAGETHAKFVKQ